MLLYARGRAAKHNTIGIHTWQSSLIGSTAQRQSRDSPLISNVRPLPSSQTVVDVEDGGPPGDTVQATEAGAAIRGRGIALFAEHQPRR